VLRPDTQRLWEHLQSEPALKGFVLVGGTALSMHLHHRLSEDLDFMYLGKTLPKGQIGALKRRAIDADFEFIANDSPAGVEEFINAGLDLSDYQQDYMVNGTVKVSLVAPEPENARQLEQVESPGPRVASLAEIFRLKCIVASDRSKTRDWFDLYLLLKQEHFEPTEVIRAFERAGAPRKYDIAMMRLCSGKPALNDEGYETLLKEPPTIEEMQRFFIETRDRIEKDVARQAMAAHQAPLPTTDKGDNKRPGKGMKRE
jgi:predicted nucleotidyltransferase component of viral defense system